MNTASLHNASTYLNNLLLARGLLRNGEPIEFSCVKKGSAGADHTMAKIINLVHDLVLQHDRGADQRESLATSIRTLRAEEAQRENEVERVRSKHAELLRDLANAEGQKRSLEASANKAEASMHELKEQMAKMKSTMDQVRAKCVNDIRKRDVELEKLKKHITSVQRRAARSNEKKTMQLNTARGLRSGATVDDDRWSLGNETNDLLAALVNETSTENVALRHIVSETIHTLKDMTGLNQAPQRFQADPEVGIPGQYKQSRVEAQSAQPEALVPCEDLADHVREVLDHCRAILKDPSFVSIEEVQIREDEIMKLREGWEKMAIKWKDAVAMMETWRKRMLEGGSNVDLDELSNLGFGKSVAVKPEARAGSNKVESSMALFDNAAEGMNSETGECKDRGSDDVEHGQDLESASAPSAKRLASSPARRGVRLPQPVTNFYELDGNAQTEQSRSEGSPFTSSNVDSGIGSLDSSIHPDVRLQKSQSEISFKV